MEKSSPGPQFLKEKYDMHNAPEVEHASLRTEKQTGEKVSQDPKERIQNYLDRFTEIVERKEPAKRERGIEALKKVMHDQFVIKANGIPEAAFLLEQRIARDLGHGDVEITEKFREEKTQQIINNQTRSLDKWIDYLSSADAQYPDWAKYWAFRSVLEMGKLEKEVDWQGKEKARFKKRTKDTVASFPPLNPRALAMAVGVLRSNLDEKEKPKKERQAIENTSVNLDNNEFKALISTENFSKIYAQFLIEMPEYSTEGLEETRGNWVKYEQGSDPTTLVESLDGYPLEWCTAEFDTAQTQLEGGDFYIYYSIDESGKAIVPRVAIRMEGSNIAEVRGIAPGQNIDPYIGDVIEKKFQDFGPEGEAYKKKSADMKLLTEIENKINKKEELTKEDLVFLYEINSEIEGFGYQRDPRIKEIRNQRDFINDMEIIFDTKNHQEIANKLIETGGGWAVVDNLEKFHGLNYREIANKLIEAGIGKAVANNLEKFQGIDQETANKLIETGGGWAVVDNLEKFHGLNHREIANKLIESGLSMAVVYNLEKLHGLNQETANRLIEARRGNEVVYNLEKFHGLNYQETANKIIKIGEGWAVANNLEKFRGLNYQETANKLIEAGIGKAVANNLEKFHGLNHREIANKLIESGLSMAVVYNLEKFHGLNQETANKLIEADMTNYVIADLEKFHGPNHQEIANKLIESGLSMAVINNLEKFQGLDQETLGILKEKHPGYFDKPKS